MDKHLFTQIVPTKTKTNGLMKSVTPSHVLNERTVRKLARNQKKKWVVK